VKLFKDLSIKVKILAGFALMGVIIVVISMASLLSLSAVQNDVTQITRDVQPAALAVSDLQSTLERANSAMGLYLLSQEELYRDAYTGSLAHADEILANLLTLPMVMSDPVIAEQVAAITADVDQFKGYQERMLFLATNSADNIPATKFTSENLSPLSVLLLQLADGLVNKESEQLATAERRKLLLDFETLRNGWSKVRYGLLYYLTYRSVLGLRDIKNARKEVEGAIDRLLAKKDLLTPDQLADLDTFIPIKDTFFQRLGEMIGIHGGDAWRTDAYLIRTEVGPLLNQISEKVNALVDAFNRKNLTTSEALAGQVNSTNTLVVILLVSGLLLATLIGWAITRAIIKPLKEALDAMEDIVKGEGDLTRRLDDASQDEIGQLARGFNQFAGVVHHIVSDIIGYTQRLTDSASRLSVVTDATSHGVDKQQAMTDQVVTAVNEMTATGEEIARNTTAAADAARNADQASVEGKTVVTESIGAINALADEVQRACTAINRVDEDSTAIGTVLDVIRGIAEQTNLLALNAAIEAARAGEQGRGFAVVADEVRTLASRTQASTEEIQSMIERLQSGTREAVSVMDQGRHRTDQSVEQAQRTGEALEKISEAVNIIKQMSVQIATAAEQQNAVSAEINRSVVEISDITDQTSAGAQQTASATNELNELADQLSAMVGQFKV